jgi:hypothetical protein
VLDAGPVQQATHYVGMHPAVSDDLLRLHEVAPPHRPAGRPPFDEHRNGGDPGTYIRDMAQSCEEDANGVGAARFVVLGHAGERYFVDEFEFTE